jgi:hypothetical protein
VDLHPGWHRWLGFSRVTWLALAIALVLTLPTLSVGFFADDYLHFATMRGLLPEGSPWDQFRFADGNPVRMKAMMRNGPYPWWTLPEIRLAFFRPLSSAVRTLEDRLAPGSAPVAHLQSVLWYLLLVAFVAGLLKQVLPGPLGGLALLIFAVDDAHFLPVAWVANRNALVAAAPAFWGLWMHLRWREQGWKPGLPWSLVGWGIGLAGGETALAVLGYGVAYELFAAPGRLSRRLVSLTPVLVLVVAYLALYRVMGCGAAGSGIYLDPLAHPLAYLRQAGPRLLALVSGALANIPSDLATWPTPAPWIIAGVGLCVVTAFALCLRQVFSALHPEERRHARWLFAGAAASLLPVVATFPSNRLLLVPSLGAAVAVAILILHGPRWSRSGAWVLVAVHLVLPPIAWPFMTWVARATVRHGQTVSEQAELDPSTVAQQRVAVLMAPEPMTALYPPILLRVQGKPAPRAWWALTLAPYDHRLTRTGPATFELEPIDGPFLRSIFELLFRSPDFPMVPGQAVQLDGLTVAVKSWDAEGPRIVSYTFDRPLEDPSLVFLSWDGSRLKRHPLPPVGASERLPFLTIPGIPH